VIKSHQLTKDDYTMIERKKRGQTQYKNPNGEKPAKE
jgi:hypothetical protein